MQSQFTSSARRFLLPAILGVLLLWAFWPSLEQMAQKWLHDPQYSHGYLVPVFSGYLLWMRRDRVAGAMLKPSWWGVAPIVLAAGLRHAASLNYDWFDGVALALTIGGFFLLVGGWTALEWSWPAVAFLMFMVPLPYSLERAVAQPLQRVATIGSTYTLQTFGLEVQTEGNILSLPSGRIEVERACSGLSMMLIFFALSTAMAVVIHRPIADRLLMLVSAVPIAIVANVTRIVITGLAQEAFQNPELAHQIFHDWGGWLMMPLALGILWLELTLVSWLFREPVDPIGVPLSWQHPLGPAMTRPTV